MKIILTKNISGVGSIGDVKNVATSYARNVLLKNKQAIQATFENISKLKAHTNKKAKEQTLVLADIEKLNNQLSSLSLTIKAKANDQGKLFAGIDGKKLSRIIKEDKNLDINFTQIKLKEPIKKLGTYEVDYELTRGLKGKFKLEIKQ